MPKQRQGSVRWNKRRKAWVARLDWQDPDRQRHCRKRQVENKSAGNSLVKEWIRDLEENGEKYLSAETLTFKELGDRYQAARLTAPVYRDGKKVAGLRDWKAQRARLARLIEYFGARRVREITFADVEAYRNQLLETPVETKKKDGTIVKSRPRSIGAVHRQLALLRATFTYAVQAEWLNRNPFSKGKGLISMAQEVPRERIFSTDGKGRPNAIRHQTANRRTAQGLLAMGIMFPFSEEALARRAATETQRAQAAAKRERFIERARLGYLKRWPMSRYERQLQADATELWLLELLIKPTLARIALDLARSQGVPLTGLKRAKKCLNVKSVRMRGKGTGRRNPWIWQPPVSK